MKVTVNLDNVDSKNVVEAVIKQLVPVITDQVSKQIDQKYREATLTEAQAALEVFACKDTKTFEKYYPDCPHVVQGHQKKYNREECIKYFKRHQIFAGEM
ncbi:MULTISPECIES: hypothetical protein [Lentilactobacillus]|jgi:hypothetical protein|uniref:Uncharacterized protein n=1 Tax=Lentilactobacillus kisonensis F0435 TaxID=797516 RepID=H1LF08_9LACO|nr:MULTISPECIES: hypothetical protein [Lentilactobacillus]EHO52247.1 hypothetical protein HMPREF9104_01184 [Lentilactobacillus kisonensis F0435]MBV0929669.1 hypothetical protein [Lentilactobacillus dabitei]MCI2019983.1 hypothetical protein [Lentilactobacillus buchneri]MDS1015246.1 hypothetical protein [Lentilactobacillus buchneri]